MTQKRILTALTTIFDTLGIAYLITGSLAVSFYGRPRYTHDADIVLDLVRIDERKILELLKQLARKFLVFADESAVAQAIAAGDMITLLDKKTEMKIDLWMLGNDPFSASVFARRRKKRVFGKFMFFISPEDLIVKKLSWFTESESTRHIEDAYTVYHGQHGRLDAAYMHEWIEKLGLQKEWQKLTLLGNPQQ